jgi:hypothetical protein
MKGVSQKLITAMKAVIIADIVTLVGGVTYLTMPTSTSTDAAATAASVSVSVDYTGTEIGDSSSESSELDQPITEEITVESEADNSNSSNNPSSHIKEEDIVYTVYKSDGKTSSDSDDSDDHSPQVEECASYYVPIEAHQPPAGTVIIPPYWWSDTRMSYMDWRTITDPTSEQWALQQRAYTDSETGIRMVDGRYCVAVGSSISVDKGALMNVTLQNGVTIPCILADCKQDCDTIDTLVGADGGIVEFVVTTEMLPGDVQILGSNEAQFNYLWQSPVESIFLYDSTDEIVW